MAERRMFAKTIIDSDAFLDMPMSTQCLYFHLSMRADDDGFINSPKKIQRVVGASDDDLKLLIAKRFIIPFESGIVVIKHWKIHNYIRSDRYKETVYQEEKAMLTLKDNGSYTVGIPSGSQVVYQMDTQDRIGKVSKDNNSSNIDDFLDNGKESKAYSSKINDFFDKCWSEYPKKRGKTQVKPAQRKRIYELGDEIFTAIKRYKAEVKDKDIQYILNGSTFFNGRYEDYIGDDYAPPKPVSNEPKPIYKHFEKEPEYKAEPMTEEQRANMEELKRKLRGVG